MSTELLSRISKVALKRTRKQLRVLGPHEHNLHSAQVSTAALTVVRTLHEGGYDAYIVGGGVRDMMLGLNPKDFDIATDARPEQVRDLFDRCRIIGRRFRLAHVFIGRERIEVATFRGGHRSRAGREHVATTLGGRILRDNAYGPIDRDAERRDFTINALFYDPRDNALLDFVDGIKDLRARQLRMLGKPVIRFREDPVRLLRVVRFAAKLEFEIDPAMDACIAKSAYLLEAISPARMFDEGVKLLHCGAAEVALDMLREKKLLVRLFPHTDWILEDEKQPEHLNFLRRALHNTDVRAREGKPLSPAFAYAVMLWPEVCERMKEDKQSKMNRPEALTVCGDRVLKRQMSTTRIPYRHAQMIREIWHRQAQLETGPRKHPARVISQGYFRAAYDFLGLRAGKKDALAEAFQAWTKIQEQYQPVCSDKPPRRRRRRRSRR